MTDTGQVPGEGLPESAGMVEQPGVPAPGAYTYLSETAAEDEDLLLPGAQGAWGNEMPPPAPEPVVQVVHEPGPHEMSGRDSGAHDLSAVRTPVATPVPQPPVARRPLHLGPPTPDASASPVRSLADRGPAGAPVPPGAARHAGPSTTGPEYLDGPQQPVSQWVGAPAQAAPARGVAEGGAAAETVVPQETPLSVAVAEAPLAAEAPQGAAADEEVQDLEALHQAQDAAYALAQEAAVAQFRTPEAVGTPVAAHLQAPEVTEAPETADAPAAHVEAPAADAAATAVEVPQAAQTTAEAEASQVAEAPRAVEPAQVPPSVEAPASDQHQIPVPGAAVEPTAAETAEAAAAAGAVEEPAQPPQAEAPQPEQAAMTPEAQAPETQVVGAPAAEEAAAATAAAQAPDATPFPPAAQDPEPIAAQTVDEAQDAPQAAPETEAAAPVDASAEDRPAEAPVPSQPEAVTADPATPPTEAAGPEQPATAPQQQTPTAVPDEPASTEAPDPQTAAVAPDEENAAASSAEQTAEVPPDTAPDTEPAQDPAQSAQTPAAEEPQPTETDQAGPHPTGQDPQVAEPDAPAANPANQEQDPAQGQTQDQDQDPSQDPAVAAQAAVTVPQPEPAQPLTSDTTAEPEATEADAAVQPTDDADAQDPAPADESTGEVPPPAEPTAAPAPASVDPASADPSVAEPLAADAQAAPASGIDAPQGAVIQPPAEPEADAPALAVSSQEPAPETEALVLPPLPEHAGPTPAAAEFPAAEGQTDAPEPQTATTEGAPETEGEPVAARVPAPRDSEAETIVVPQPLAAAGAHPDVVQSAEDLDTRAAGQEDDETTAPEAAAVESAAEESAAPVEEVPEDVRDEVRQPTGPAAPPYDDAEREAVLKVMRERRDIRNGFRSDPIPHDVLLRVLEAAHTAPSVGHSQPWDFVVIRSAETRRTMHELAQRQREAYAKSLPKGRAKQFKELKIEAILDTPVNIVVTADPTRGGRHTLGRHTQPQMAPYSSALAVENLWLAARAEGLGVGWVSFFDEREMVRALGLPEHLEVVAYLCVGYVDEFPEEPELMQAGWAKRRPLSWVVHEETYGRRALPGAEPHDLLAETVAGIRPLDAKALGEAWERQKRMTKPAGALGMLEIISAQLAGCPASARRRSRSPRPSRSSRATTVSTPRASPPGPRR